MPVALVAYEILNVDCLTRQSNNLTSLQFYNHQGFIIRLYSKQIKVNRNSPVK